MSGYHTLPQQDMYWEGQSDAGIPLVYEVISKNKFKQMKKYTIFLTTPTFTKVISMLRWDRCMISQIDPFNNLDSGI